MSVYVMSLVWKCGPSDSVDRLVLLAIADHANDDGVAFPSMIGIAEKSCLTDRGARKVVRRLEDAGWMQTEVGGGRGGRSVYRINLTRMFPKNPEQETRNAVPSISENPERECINPEHECTKPGTLVPPNHHITIKEPSEEKIDARGILGEVASDEAATSFIAYRKRVRKPLTETGAARIRNSLQLIRDQGGDPDDALGMAEERGWQSIKPDWYFKETRNEPSQNRRPANANPATSAILAAVRLSEAQDADRRSGEIDTQGLLAIGGGRNH